MIKYDSELGNYIVFETPDPREFRFLIERDTKKESNDKINIIAKWWKDTGFSKNNWMLLQGPEIEFNDHVHDHYNFFQFTLLFAVDEDLMAFKLGWL